MAPCVEITWRARGEFLRGGTNSLNPSPFAGESISRVPFVAAGSNAAIDQRLFHADGRARLWRCRRDGALARSGHAARWIFRKRPKELHVRRLQREEQLPGLRSAEQIRNAAEVLVGATWAQ